MNITIEALQAYLSDRYGGWANEQGLFMKLVEEIGEVAEVLNKRAGRKASDGNDLQEELGTELADMLHYIVAIAAINEIPSLQNEWSLTNRLHYSITSNQKSQQK